MSIHDDMSPKRMLDIVAEATAVDFEGVWVDNETGQIMSKFTCSRPMEMEQRREGMTLIEGVFDPETEYFLDGEVTDRPELDVPASASIMANGVQEFVVTVPNETQVRDNGVTVGTVDDGEFRFRTAFEGEHTFLFLPPFPYINATTKVTANAV